MESSWPIERQWRPPREPLRLLLGPTDPGHVLFVAGPSGFSIVERTGEPPKPEQVVLLDERAYRVAAVRRSPFPHDRRPCFVLMLEP